MEIIFKNNELPATWCSKQGLQLLHKEGVKHLSFALSTTESIKKIKGEQFNNAPSIFQRGAHLIVGSLLCIPLINLVTFAALRILGFVKYVKENAEKQEEILTNQSHQLFFDDHFPLPLKQLAGQYFGLVTQARIANAGNPMWALAINKIKTEDRKNVEEGIKIFREALIRSSMLTPINATSFNCTLWVNEKGAVKAIEAPNYNWPNNNINEVDYNGLFPMRLTIKTTGWDGKSNGIIKIENDVRMPRENQPSTETIALITELYLAELNVIAKQAWICAENNKKKDKAKMNQEELLMENIGLIMSRNNHRQRWFNIFTSGFTREELLLIEALEN